MKTTVKLSILLFSLVIFIAACGTQKDGNKTKEDKDKAEEIANTYMLKKNDPNKQDDTFYSNYKDPFSKSDLNDKKTAFKDKSSYNEALKGFNQNVQATPSKVNSQKSVKYKGKQVTPKFLADSDVKGGYDVKKDNYDEDVQSGKKDDYASKSFGKLKTPLTYHEIEKAELHDAKYLNLAHDSVDEDGSINDSSAKYSAEGYTASPFATSEKGDGFGLWWVGKDTTDSTNIKGKHVDDVPEHGGILHVKMNYGNDSNKKVKIKDIMNLSHKNKEMKPAYVSYQDGSNIVEDKYSNVENDTTQHSKVSLDLYYVIDEDMRNIKEPFYSIAPTYVDAPINKKYQTGVMFEPVEVYSNITGHKAADDMK